MNSSVVRLQKLHHLTSCQVSEKPSSARTSLLRTSLNSLHTFSKSTQPIPLNGETGCPNMMPNCARRELAEVTENPSSLHFFSADDIQSEFLKRLSHMKCLMTTTTCCLEGLEIDGSVGQSVGRPITMTSTSFCFWDKTQVKLT